MSLDAKVYCDSLERGRLRTPPLPQWNLYVDEYGGRSRSSLTGVLDDDLAFDRWNVTACEHEDGVLVHHYLGNIARVGLVREALSGHAESFPIILGKIVYDGIHASDFLSVEQVERGALRTDWMLSLPCRAPIRAATAGTGVPGVPRPWRRPSRYRPHTRLFSSPGRSPAH